MASAASDWGLELVTYPMSIMIAAGGITAALTGKWTLKVVYSLPASQQQSLILAGGCAAGPGHGLAAVRGGVQRGGPGGGLAHPAAALPRQPHGRGRQRYRLHSPHTGTTVVSSA